MDVILADFQGSQTQRLRGMSCHSRLRPERHHPCNRTMGLPGRPEEAHVLGYPGFDGSGLSTAHAAVSLGPRRNNSREDQASQTALFVVVSPTYIRLQPVVPSPMCRDPGSLQHS
jgi:hypothetical protein